MRRNPASRRSVAYVGYGTSAASYRAVDNHIYDRVRCFLVRPHKVQGRCTRRLPVTMSTANWACFSSSACTLGHAVRVMMKPVGKLDAGNPRVPFDERGGETERGPTRHRALPQFY